MKYAAIFTLASIQARTLLQLNDCNRSGVAGAGVSCEPAREILFATGMNGDEDLGEDITMKGNKFHFNQEPSFVQWDYTTKGLPAIPYPDPKTKEEPRKDGWNAGYDEPEKVHTLDPKTVLKSTTFY